MGEAKIRREWHSKHRTHYQRQLFGRSLLPGRLRNSGGKLFILICIATVAGVMGASVTSQVLAYKLKQLQLARSGEPAKPAFETTTVVVAASPLRFGSALTDDSLRETVWVKGTEPAGSYRTIKDLLAEAPRRTALGAIEIDEPILATKITGPNQRSTLSALVDETMRAVAVKVDDVNGVAGFVLPGDYVDILLTRISRPGEFNTARTDVLLQKVRVLGIDQQADDRTEEPSVVKTVTLQVNTEMAQKLALAQRVGSLSLALRSAGSAHEAEAMTIDVADLVPASANNNRMTVIRGVGDARSSGSATDGPEEGVPGAE